MLVLTVDPAKRLANALGLQAFGNTETRVPDEAFTSAGVTPRGELWAAMLDTKAGWDELIRRHAPDAKLRDTQAILRQAAATLDLSQPVGVLLPANLAFVRDLDTAQGIVADLMAGLPSGSHLMVTHHASDLFVEEHAEMFRCIERLAAEQTVAYLASTRAAQGMSSPFRLPG